MFLIHIFIATTCIITGMAFNGTMQAFLDAPSIFIVLIPSVVLTIASYGMDNMKNAFSFVVPKTASNPQVLCNTATSFGNYCIWFGIISTLIGAVKVLAMWSETTSSTQIAAATSVMFLPLTYGFCIYALLAKPFADRWKRIDDNG